MIADALTDLLNDDLVGVHTTPPRGVFISARVLESAFVFVGLSSWVVYIYPVNYCPRQVHAARNTPTRAQTHNNPQNMSTTTDQEETTLHELFARKVVRLGEHLAVKSGPNLRAHEAPTLQFIAENTTIPVPKVHDVRWENGRVAAIVMDYMPGKPLNQIWETLSHDQKCSIANQLHSYVSQLRELKGSYIGAIDRGKAVIGLITAVECGPFESESEFNEFIMGDLVNMPDLLHHYSENALVDNHEIVFTHGDFAPRNILVEGDHVTAILDWEDAGWYPEHWEYLNAMTVLKPMPDWPEYLSMILPPRYEKEYIGMMFLSRLARH